MAYFAEVKDVEETWQQVNAALAEMRDTVCATMGPGAGYVCISNAAPGGNPIVVKDGVTVGNFLKYKDPLKNAIATIVNNAAKTTVRLAGDGTTTATLLTVQLTLAIRHTIQKRKNEDSPILTREVIRDLRKLEKQTIILLEKMVKLVDSQDVLEKVALIACDSNKHIAKVVSEAVWKVGVNGRVFIEDSPGEEIKMEYEDGYVFGDKRTPVCFDPFFIIDKAKGETVLENPYIFIADEEFDTFDKVEPILRAYVTKKESNLLKKIATPPLLMIVSDCFGPAKAALLQNMNDAPIFVVKCPDFNSRRSDLLEDIAWLTDTPKVFSDLKGNVLDNFGDEYVADASEGRLVDERWRAFGRAKQVKFTKHLCVIKHDIEKEDIESKVYTLKEAMRLSNIPTDINFYEERISKLVGGIATIYVGAFSATEATNAKLSVDDTIRSCFCALREGVLPGAGVALKEIAGLLRKKKNLYLRYDEVLEDFIAMLLSPFKKIRENLEVGTESVMKEGFASIIDPTTGESAPALKCGIIDPYLVTRTALMSAISTTTQLVSIRKYVNSEDA